MEEIFFTCECQGECKLDLKGELEAEYWVLTKHPKRWTSGYHIVGKSCQNYAQNLARGRVIQTTENLILIDYYPMTDTQIMQMNDFFRAHERAVESILNTIYSGFVNCTYQRHNLKTFYFKLTWITQTKVSNYKHTEHYAIPTDVVFSENFTMAEKLSKMRHLS